MGKKLKLWVSTIIISLSLMGNASVMVKAEEQKTSQLVEQALTEKSFYHYNLAYEAIMKMEESKEKSELLNKLNTISSLVWTEDYITAVNSLTAAWTQKDKDSVKKAEKDIAQLKESYSKEYLLGELSKIKTVVNVIVVQNTKELLANIGPERTLVLKAGDYNLLSEQGIKNDYIRYEEVYDGVELVAENLKNLNIKVEAGAKVQLLVEPRYADVLTFNNSSNIRIENIIAGHYPEKGSCVGGVFLFDGCKDITVENSELFGCGTVGVTLDNVENFLFDKSTIKECSYGIANIYNSKNVKFNEANFYDCETYDLININESENVEFNKCDIYNNTAKVSYAYDTMRFYLFNIDDKSKVVVNGGKIRDNTLKALVNDEKLIQFNNVEIKNNNTEK